MSSSNSDSPGWARYSGTRRVVAEFRSLKKHVSSYGFIKDLLLASDDNPMLWRLQFHNFDAAVPGGWQLNEDLKNLNRMYGQDHILLELQFPPDYPSRPFFARVVSPRCVLYTGHVSAGGSICLEALTTSGTPGSWQSSFTVESLLNVIMVNMIDTPVVYIQTPTGPGGMTGPLRIELSRGNPCNYSGYSSSSARAAFNRTVDNHKKMGWSGPVMDTQQATTHSSIAGSSAAASVAVSAPVPAAAATNGSSTSGASPGLNNRGLLGFLMTPSGFIRSPSSSTAVGKPSACGAGSSSSSSSAAHAAALPDSASTHTFADSLENGSAPSGSQQPTAAAEVSKTPRLPRLLLEFDYPEHWDHSVPMVNHTVRLVELPLPANIRGTHDSRQAQLGSGSTGYRNQWSYSKPVQLKDGPITTPPPLPTSQAVYAAVSRASALHKRARHWASHTSATPVSTRPYVHPLRSPTNQAPMLVPGTLLPAGGCSRGNRTLDPLEAAAQQNCVASSDIQTLIRHCPSATEKDAKAALLLSEGDLDGAAVVMAMTLECGGAARRWREMFGESAGSATGSDTAMGGADFREAKDPQAPSSQAPLPALGDPAAMAALLAQRRNEVLTASAVPQPKGHAAVSAEVESLLQHMEANGGGLHRSQVAKIERVQHSQLWLKYCIRRAEVEVANGTHGINEQLLYHGTSSTAAEIIIREGFDIRMANSGSYGRGTYFSNSSGTAFGYCRSKERSSCGSSTAVYKLLVARVALGRQCQGSSGCTKPGAGFDSLHGHQGVSHVVFDNHQAYPEYIITLRQ